MIGECKLVWLVSIHRESRWLVVLDLFDRSKVLNDKPEMTIPMNGTERPRRSSVGSKSRRNRYLGRNIPLQDLRNLGLIYQAQYQEVYHHRCLLLDGFRHWDDLQPTKAPPSAVVSAHHHCTDSLAPYLWARSLDNGI